VKLGKKTIRKTRGKIEFNLTREPNCLIIKLMRLNERQRNSLAKVLYDFAKYTFAGLVLAQIVAAEKFRFWILILGIISVVVLIFSGLILEGGEK